MKKILLVFTALCAIALLSHSAQAQFKNGKDMIGPHIGLSQYGGAFTLGGMFEAPITHPNDAGPGIIGISGQLNWYHYSYYLDNGVTWIIFGVYGNYHFLLDDRKIDPFLGLGLNYQHVSFDGSGYGYGSGLYFGVQAGVRYYFSPNLAGRLMVGNAASFLTLGIDFGI
ncbi:MAG TPA: hypothetical protein VEW28_09090 [Candidatus Kapabacteria bacterium]|nr:hypothetical protein [Candidatus Kapabacteria bacterium]